jgi:hypothetical protein
MDIGAFRTAMFEFGCGGRMVGLWQHTWGWLNDMDLHHVCSREDVTQFCIDWPKNSDEFGDICSLVSAMANGDFKKEHAKWLKYARKRMSSENASAVFSGAIDFANLQGRSPSVRRKKQVVDEKSNLEAIVVHLQAVWDGTSAIAPENELAMRDRDQVKLK